MRLSRRWHPASIPGLLLVALSFAPAPPAEPPAAPNPAAAPTPEMSALLRARHQAAVKQFDETWVYYRQARTEAFLVYTWSRFVLESEFDLASGKPDRLAALEAHFDRMKKLEALVKKVRKLGFGQSIEVGATEYYRIEAESWLAHERPNPP